MSKRDLGLDLYAVLGLEPSASADEIRRAVRVFTLKWHPDRNPEGSATARMAEINEARRVLLDPILRAEYDRAYAAGATGRSKSATPRLIPATVDFGRLVPGGPQQHQTVHVFADGGWPSKVQIRPTFGDLWKQTGVEVPEDGDDEVVRLLLSASAPTSHSAGRFVEHTEVVFDDAAVADLTLRFDVPVTAAPSDPRPRPKPPPTGATSAPPTPPSKPKTSPPKPRTPAASPAMGFLARNRTWLWPLGATFIGSLIGGAIAQVDLKHGGAGTDGFVLIIVSILAGGFWSAFARGDGLLAGVVNSFLFWFLVAIPGAGIGVGVGSLLSDGAHSESAVAEAAKVPGVEWVVDAEKFQDAASDDPSSSFYLTPRRLLYVSPDGVTALDRRSGHEIWSWSQGFCVRSCGFSSPGFLGQRAGALWFSDINQTWSVNPSTGRPTKRPDLYLTALGGNVAFDGDFDNSGSLLLLPTLRKLPLDRHAHKVSSGAFQVNKATTIPTGIVLSVLHASSWVGLIGIGPDSYGTELLNSSGKRLWAYTSDEPLTFVTGGGDGRILLFTSGGCWNSDRGYVVALDARTGVPLWTVRGCADSAYPAGRLWLTAAAPGQTYPRPSVYQLRVLDTVNGHIRRIVFRLRIADAKVLAVRGGRRPQVALAANHVVGTDGTIEARVWRLDLRSATATELRASGQDLSTANVVIGDARRLFVLDGDSLKAIRW